MFGTKRDDLVSKALRMAELSLGAREAAFQMDTTGYKFRSDGSIEFPDGTICPPHGPEDTADYANDDHEATFAMHFDLAEKRVLSAAETHKINHHSSRALIDAICNGHDQASPRPHGDSRR